MFETKRVELDWGGRKLTLETGRMARQADAAVLAQYGETTVLATVVAEKSPRPGRDFFPLTVNYQEKTFAAGKIPGGFFKREGRPSEKETLTSRLIDRPIRPLFVDGFKNDTQVVVTVLSHDMENDPDIVGMVAASAALTLSGVPFLGPIAAARVGLIDGQFVLNPMIDEMAKSDLDLVVAGTVDAVMMVELEAKELPEKQMLEAVMFGQRGFQPVIQAIIKLAEKAAKEPWDFQPPDKSKYKDKARALVEADLRKAFATPEKQKRHELVDACSAKVKELLPADASEDEKVLLSSVFKGLEQDVVRGDIIKTKKRIDGRDLKTVRPIVSEVHVLPRTHGSALFTRGETQALVVATLGTGEDEQYVDALEGTRKERFLLHYNFPPYSVGETGRMGSPGRREIGHGKLAWRAVRPLMPSPEEFPYTVRIVSEITESNGSSSMATVCGSSLALMDAGVPLKAPVAGIAMGLIKEGNEFAVLSDILGDEDHLGDMDFKVAGTEKGVTSLQMDIKITGITEEIMRVALDQAHARPPAHPGRDGQGHHGRAHRARRACAAHRDDQDPGRQDPRSDRLGRLGDPRDRGRERRQDRHRGRRHHQDRRCQARGDRGGDEPHQGHHAGARGRHDLQGQGREGHGVRRLRELLRPQGRPRAHLAADAGSARDRGRGRQGGPGGLRQAARLRRSRQGAPVDEDRSTRRPARRSRARKASRRRSSAASVRHAATARTGRAAASGADPARKAKGRESGPFCAGAMLTVAPCSW